MSDDLDHKSYDSTYNGEHCSVCIIWLESRFMLHIQTAKIIENLTIDSRNFQITGCESYRRYSVGRSAEALDDWPLADRVRVADGLIKICAGSNEEESGVRNYPWIIKSKAALEALRAIPPQLLAATDKTIIGRILSSNSIEVHTR